MSDVDLTFATTEELVDEMFKRHEAIAIVRIPKGQQGAGAFVDHNGPFYTVVGLVAQLQHDLINKSATPTQD